MNLVSDRKLLHYSKLDESNFELMNVDSTMVERVRMHVNILKCLCFNLVLSFMIIYLFTSVEGPEQQPSNNWQGFFNVYSYTQYFDVDTDVVVNRLMSSLYPTSGDFFNKIDANPDL